MHDPRVRGAQGDSCHTGPSYGPAFAVSASARWLLTERGSGPAGTRSDQPNKRYKRRERFGWQNEKPPITSKMETDYVKDRTETEYVGNGKVKSGLLLRFILDPCSGVYCAALAALCHASAKWRAACVSGLTQKSNSQNMAHAAPAWLAFA